MKKRTLLPRMWQQLFAAILFLVLLAQITPLVLVFLQMPTPDEQRKTGVDFFCGVLAANLDGRNLSDAHMYMDYFNKAGPELWLERNDGTVLAGTPVPGFTLEERAKLPSVPSPRPDAKVWHGAGTWNYQEDLPLDLLGTGVVFRDAGPATMFIIYPNYRLPQISDNFYTALAIMLLAGVLTSYLVSRRLSAPLRRLQQGVMNINEDNLDQPLPVPAIREMASVTHAVNNLMAELSNHTRNMTELVANVSHELRSPLARMEGHASFIDDGFDKASARVEALESRLHETGNTPPQPEPEDERAIHRGLRHLTLLKEELNHMDNLVGTTLLSSRLNLSRTLPPFTPVDMTALCRDILRKRRLFIGNKGVTLSHDLAGSVTVSGDAVLLGQMVSNLVDNAVKYVSDRGRITVTLEQTSDTVRLAIENTHPPFSADELTRLFEPFFRAGRTTGTGVGLGLSLVGKIADIHSATVRASNTVEGLLLEVRFPCAWA